MTVLWGSQTIIKEPSTRVLAKKLTLRTLRMWQTWRRKPKIPQWRKDLLPRCREGGQQTVSVSSSRVHLGCSADILFPGQPVLGTEPRGDINGRLFWSNMAQLGHAVFAPDLCHVGTITSLCPILLPSLCFHRCWSPINILHPKLHLSGVCLQRAKPVTGRKGTVLYNGQQTYLDQTGDYRKASQKKRFSSWFLQQSYILRKLKEGKQGWHLRTKCVKSTFDGGD